MTYITFGVIRHPAGDYDTACRIIDCASEDRAIAIAEALGNVKGTTVAYTDEALIALACERADYVEAEVEAQS